MLFDDWYQDLMTIYRNEGDTDGFEDTKVRTLKYENIPCRMYNKALNSLQTPKGSAKVESDISVAVDVNVDIKSGDEVYILRQGESESKRYFVGNIKSYRMPLGMYDVGLDHKEVSLHYQEDT